ncbi:MAG: response regulator [Rubrobacter sp.]|nr:response regulator [Rubrobacter sp.]
MDRRPTIMVADDDPEVLERAADALDDAGFRVVKVTNGQVALQEALGQKVDLIVMDVSIPYLSGVDTCHCLKAMPKTAKIPVVFTAAKKDPAAKALAERTHGSVRVLKKPFTAEELVSVVRGLVRSKSLI